MRITFSARAWMLSAAVGFISLPAATTAFEVRPAVPTSSQATKATSTNNRAKIIPVAATQEPRRFDGNAAARPALSSGSLESNGIRQTAGSNGIPIDSSSEVQRKLEEIYRKNGREMPPMQVNQLPEQNLKQKIAPLSQVSSQPTPTAQPQTVAQTRMGKFFQNINPFKKSENDERPKHVESMPADVMRQQQALQAQPTAVPPNRQYQQPQARPQQAGNNFVPPPPALPGAEPAPFNPPSLLNPPVGTIGRPITPPATLNELPEFRPAVQLPQENKAAQLPKALVAPAAKLPEIAPKLPEQSPKLPEVPTLSEATSETPFTGEVEVKKPATDAADDLDNAFPEMSETEADAAKRLPKARAAEATAPKLEVPAAKPATPPATLPMPESEKPQADETPDANPFTGLKLEAETAVKDAVKSAADAAESKAPLLPSLKELPMGLKLPEPAKLSASNEEDDDDDDDDDELTGSKSEPSNDANSKMKMIAQRKELKGLKGFCPVVLRDKRDLVDARPQFKTVYLGKVYNFSSQEALESFGKTPTAYAPIAGGRDVVMLKDQTEDVEGQLDHAAWFKDRLYLFSTAKSKEAFELQPSKYVVEE